jgi:class 3 adenylate cyclase
MAAKTPGVLEIAHVLFLDVVRFSAMPMERQKETIERLQRVARSAPSVRRAQAKNQVLYLSTGDGLALVFFGSPESPVCAAIDIAQVLSRRPKIDVRMGIHSGPVYRVADINANRNVSGGGINELVPLVWTGWQRS